MSNYFIKMNMKNLIILSFICLSLFALNSCKSGSTNTSVSKLLGCDLSQKEFDKAEVFEPLSETSSDNEMPSKISLLQYAPKRLSQGGKGSCTSWAACYAAGTILWAQAKGEDPNTLAFSPDFIYNQMTEGNCTGTHIGNSLKLIVQGGLLPLTVFPYNENGCDLMPSNDEKQQAKQFKLKGFNRLTLNGDDYKIDLQAIKQNLAQKAPVVIGMLVGGTFYDVTDVWEPTKKDRKNMKESSDGHIVDDGNNSAFGGHAMCVIGYDDNKNGGSFQIMNSWGNDWGNDGLFWMKYDDFEEFVNSFYGEAYGLYPMGSKDKKVENEFVAGISLVINKSEESIPFTHIDNNTFETEEKFKAGTTFKIAVRNEIECYTYVFGKETDGSSYVLFPYTKKHSAYCGITGTRLFPKDHSLQLDNKGKKDEMAVVFTKEPIDYKELNEKISEGTADTYEERIKEALGDQCINKVKFKDGNEIKFKANSKGKNAVVVVFQINKRK